MHLRMQGVIDQMAAAVARIDALGITLRDIERGLIDFPALVGGRQVWLCWQLGERDVAFWHELDTGFGSPPAPDRAALSAVTVATAGEGPIVQADGRAKVYRPLPARRAGRRPSAPGSGTTRPASPSRPTRPGAGLDGHRRPGRAGARPGAHQGRRGRGPRWTRQRGRRRPQPRGRARSPALRAHGRRRHGAGARIDLDALIALVDARLAIARTGDAGPPIAIPMESPAVTFARPARGRRRGGRAPPARGPRPTAPRRRPRAERVPGGPGARGHAPADLRVRRPGRGAAHAIGRSSSCATSAAARRPSSASSSAPAATT